MPLPTFLIAGAQKSGTSWLAKRLQQHPEVFVPQREVHFFDRDERFALGEEAYASAYTAVADELAIADKTPDYLWVRDRPDGPVVRDYPARIHSVLPGAKVILLLRNPVDRAVSALNHHLRARSFSPLHSADDLLVGARRAVAERYGVLSMGFYRTQIDAFLDHFDRSRLLVQFYEEAVVRDPAGGLREVCDFIGVDPDYPFDLLGEPVHKTYVSKAGLLLDYYVPALRPLALRLNRRLPGDAKLRPSPATEAALYDLYRPENERLAELLGPLPPEWNGPARPVS